MTKLYFQTVNEIYSIADEIIILEKKKGKKGFGMK